MLAYFTTMHVANVGPKDLLSFRLELAIVHLLLKEVGLRNGMQHSSGGMDRAQSENVLPVSEIGLKRGRCHQCLPARKRPPQSTSFGCGVCSVRLPVLLNSTVFKGRVTCKKNIF